MLHALKMFAFHKTLTNIFVSVEKWLVCFSVTTRSIHKSTIPKTEDYKKLKCMQGIRTYQTILVIFGHIILNLNQKHIKNDEYVERVRLSLYAIFCPVYL